MKTVVLETEAYVELRKFLRFAGLTFRDCGSSVVVPSWGECVARADVCYQNKTASEIAYKSLQAHYPGLRLKWRQEELELLDWRAPQLFTGEVWGDLYYVDIKSAFAQFYEFLFLHSEWPFKRQKYPLAPLVPELRDMKVARNAVVGIARSTRNKWVKGGEVTYTRKVNPYLSPTLWAQLCGLLNQIALFAEQEGAIWINTDGFVFKKEKPYLGFVGWLLDNGIVVRHGWGKGYVRALQNIYVQGVKEVSSLDIGRHAVRNMTESDINFLRLWRLNRERFNCN